MLIKIYSKLSQRIKRNKRDLAIDDSGGSKVSKYFLGACATQPHQSKICPAVKLILGIWYQRVYNFKVDWYPA